MPSKAPSDSQLKRLHAMGCEVYAPRAAAPTPTPTLQVDSAKAAEGDWDSLQHEVASCERCVLHQTRTQTVFGVGDPQAEWMFIGEAPGFEEDRQGEPFVGRAGKLLDKMIAAIGLDRSTVYIANTVKCRPPDNRNPRPEEVEQCAGYLERQIATIRPKIVIALGAVAAQTLLQTDVAVGKLRGVEHKLPGADIPLVVTYHPAYLLRSPNQKKATWQDLQFACQLVGREIT